MSAFAIEAFFVGWTFLGVALGLLNLAHVINDWRHVRQFQVNAGREFVVMDEVRRVILWLIVQVALVVIAVVAIQSPNRDVESRTWVEWFVLGSLLVLPAASAMSSLMDILARRRLRQMYRDRDYS